MKAKYKIGQLAKINDDLEESFIYGTVTAVVTKSDGYSYQLEDGKITVDEDDVLEVYMPLKTAKRASPKKSRAAKKKANVSLGDENQFPI